RSRRQAARGDRRRQHALGQRLPPCRVDLAAVATVPGSHVRRDPRGGSSQDHLGERGAAVRLQAELASEGSRMHDGFVRVMATSELPPGDMKFVVIDRQRVLVLNVGGTFYAMSDIC